MDIIPWFWQTRLSWDKEVGLQLGKAVKPNLLQESRKQHTFHHIQCPWLALHVAACLCLGAASARGAVLFVSATQTNNPPNGASWSTAFPVVQQALNVANDGDHVWVAAGIYFENIKVTNGVALYGGFAGTESTLNQRDWTNHLSILDGRQSNSVIRMTSPTNTTRLDGFVIRNGFAADGGGIYCSNASPTISHNSVILNQAARGGGIFLLNGAPVVTFNLIQGNKAASFCGGVYCLGTSVKIQNNRIIGNNATRSSPSSGNSGGIIYHGIFTNQISEIDGNLLLGNLIGDADQSSGSGMRLNNPAGSLSVVNNTILWNQSTRFPFYEGPAIYCSTGAVMIANNIIAFNRAGVRGGPETVFKNNCVFGNYSSNYVDVPDQTGANGNISVDPKFVPDPYYPDIHIVAGSPCRDAGDNSSVLPDWKDVDSGPRVVGAVVDIGADEFDGSPVPFVPAIVRVSPNGDDANDGSTWADSVRTVQMGIDRAMLHGGGEVWVQSGTYVENLELRHSIHLYGGLQGNETNRVQRDWISNVTILDGNQTGSVIAATNLVRWNSIDGFVIRNGRNTSGGGILSFLSAPCIVNNLIISNTTWNNGGGIYYNLDRMPTNFVFPLVTNNIISSNQAAKGGGVYYSCGQPVCLLLANNRFEENICSLQGGAINLDFVPSSASSALIQNNFFLRNIVVGNSGGAIHSDFVTAWIVNNTFVGNQAGSSGGGAIRTFGNGGVIANNLIVFGSSGYNGSVTNFWNNCVYGNILNYVGTDLTGTNGNISTDPLLVATNDYHLGPNSPCINAGTNSVISPGWLDLDRQMRVAGGVVDIGADEFGSGLPFWLSLRLDTGQSYVGLHGETNRVYVFEASSNLVNWTAISTNQTTNVFTEITDADPVASNRFYRVLLKP